LEWQQDFVLVIRSLKCSIDIYMYIMFIKVVRFLAQEKVSKSKRSLTQKQMEQEACLTPRQKAVYYSSIILATMNLYHAISSVTFYYLRYLNDF
jgi:hypothetical protein